VADRKVFPSSALDRPLMESFRGKDFITQENKDCVVMRMCLSSPLHVTVRAETDLEETSGILAGYLQKSDTKKSNNGEDASKFIKCMLAPYFL
jgi:hypothetical protein